MDRGKFAWLAVTFGAFLGLGMLFPIGSAQAGDPDEIFSNSLTGITYLANRMPDDSIVEGSGVLVDKDRRLVVTSAHVTLGETELTVHFPARDLKGNLIADRSYYKNEYARLSELGYSYVGRVIAENKLADLALIALPGIPANAVAIPFASSTEIDSLYREARLHILGNPAGRDLWRWNQGSFISISHSDEKVGAFGGDFEVISLYGAAYNGDSGGAVLTDEGKLLGIAQSIRGEGVIRTSAVAISEVNKLLKTVRRLHSFIIYNDLQEDFHFRTVGCGIADKGQTIKSNKGMTYTCPDRRTLVRYSYRDEKGENISQSYGLTGNPIYMGKGGVADPKADSPHRFSARIQDGKLVIVTRDAK